MSDIFSEDLQNNQISRSIFYTCTSNLNSNHLPNLHVLTVTYCDIRPVKPTRYPRRDIQEMMHN